MKYEIAKDIVSHLKQCDTHLEAVLEIIERIEDNYEKDKMRRRGANLIGTIYTDILRPIEIEHPSLII